MALRDTWHRALVYFGLAEDHDYGPEYEEDFEPETGSEEVFEGRRDREQSSVRRLPTSLPAPPAPAPPPPRGDAQPFPRRGPDPRQPHPHAAPGRQRRRWWRFRH